MTGLFYIEDLLEVKSALKGKTLKLAKKKTGKIRTKVYNLTKNK